MINTPKPSKSDNSVLTEASLNEAIEQMSKRPEPVILMNKPDYDRLIALKRDKILWLGPIFINWSGIKRKLKALA